MTLGDIYKSTLMQLQQQLDEENKKMAMVFSGPAPSTQVGVAMDNATQAMYTPQQKLCMRLNIPGGIAPKPFHFLIAVMNPEKGNVVVFMIINGQPITLEDDAPMFPSDALIGKINTLR